MLESKTIAVDGLQSKVADIIAEELQIQENAQNNFYQAIEERTDVIRKEIFSERIASGPIKKKKPYGQNLRI